VSTYVNVRCGSCRASLTGGYTAAYYAIGEPIITCRKCGAPNSDAERCTEWQLMSGARKSYLLIKVVFTSIFWAIGLFFVMFIAALAMNDDLPASQIMLFAAIAVTVSVSYRILQIRRLIRLSNERMADPKYRLLLAKAGVKA
jgi:hypothetical protein